MAFRFQLDRRGVIELLKSPGVQVDLHRRAERVAESAGPGHRVEDNVGRNRARSAVITDTFQAMHAEATERNLTRAMDAARG